MRDLFPEFNTPSEKEIRKAWEEAIFVFDTNVILDLYRFPEETRGKLLAIFKKLKQRMWIPHQVALEYYRKRKYIIYEQQDSYAKVVNILEKSVTQLESDLRNVCSRHPYVESRAIIEKFSDTQKELIADIKKKEKKHPDWIKNDEIEKSLNNLFKGKVGKPYSKVDLDKIYKQGTERYAQEIPPGYKDIEKDNADKTKTRKFGDLLVWFQVIDKAKHEKKPVVFVTNEQHEDWWWITKNNKTISARYELIREFFDETGVRLYIYQTDQFMKYASKNLSININKDVIDSIKEFTNLDISFLQDIVKSTTDSRDLGVMAESVRNFSNAIDLNALTESARNFSNAINENTLTESARNFSNAIDLNALTESARNIRNITNPEIDVTTKEKKEVITSYSAKKKALPINKKKIKK